MQGSLRTSLISYLSFVVLIIVFIGRCGCLRLLSNLLGGVVVYVYCSDLLGGVVVCACCRIYWGVWLFTFIGWCRCLCLLSDWLGGADVSAVGTALLQSPGWNERPLGRSLPKDKFYLFFCGALQNAVIARH